MTQARLRLALVAALFVAVPLLFSSCGDDSPSGPGDGGGATASAVEAVSGDAETDTVGTALSDPLVVEVTDENGTALSGVEVDWSAEAGELSSSSSTTGSDGRASVDWTLATTAGTDTATATVSGLDPVQFAATAVPDRPAGVAVTPDTVGFTALGHWRGGFRPHSPWPRELRSFSFVVHRTTGRRPRTDPS